MKRDILAAGQFPGYFLQRSSVTVPKILSCRGWGFWNGRMGISPARGESINFVCGLQGLWSKFWVETLSSVVNNTPRTLPSVGGY